MTRREHDAYSTDPGLARWAVQHARNMAYIEPDPYIARILEPCCGDDAPFANAGAELGLTPYGYDLRDISPKLWEISGESMGNFRAECDMDAFNVGDPFGNGSYDIVATNPPFSIGEAVVRQSMSRLKPQGAAAFLFKLSFMSTQKRSELFVARPPAEVWILRARPSFTGDGGTDVAQEYAFGFWYGAGTDAMLKAMGQRFTRLYWLDNSKMMGKKRVRIEKGKVE